MPRLANGVDMVRPALRTTWAAGRLVTVGNRSGISAMVEMDLMILMILITRVDGVFSRLRLEREVLGGW